MNDQLKQKYIELQILNQEIEQVESYIRQIQKDLHELLNAQDSLTEITKVKPDTKMLAPLGAGIFIESKITASDTILMNIGSNTVVKKSIPGAKKIIDEQLIKLNELLNSITNNYKTACQYKEKIHTELMKMQKSLK